MVTKLQEKDIPIIHYLIDNGFDDKKICLLFDVSRRAIRHVRDGTRWGHIKRKNTSVSPLSLRPVPKEKSDDKYARLKVPLL